MHCGETGLRGSIGQDPFEGLWVGKQWMPFVVGCGVILVGEWSLGLWRWNRGLRWFVECYILEVFVVIEMDAPGCVSSRGSEE